MADHFLGALKELERRSHDNVMVFSDVLAERLDALTESMLSSAISDNDYMKVMELYYQKYQKAKEKKAMMYCLLRIQQMAQYKQNVKMQKKIKTVEFSKQFDDLTFQFLQKKRPYYKNLKVDLKKRALQIGFLCSSLFLVLAVLAFGFPFLVGWIISMIVFILIFILMINIGFPYFYETYLEQLRKEIDPLCAEFDAHFLANQGSK